MVRGVEIIPAAIENAKENARLNGFDNTEFLWEKSRGSASRAVCPHW